MHESEPARTCLGQPTFPGEKGAGLRGVTLLGVRGRSLAMSFGTWVWWIKVGIAGAVGEFCRLSLMNIFLWGYFESKPS